MPRGKEYESVSPLFDEIVAHRLGLVPVPTDLTMKEKDKCECGGEGCPSCMIGYSLFKTGPCDVYSGDLLPLAENDTGIRVKDDMIPLVRLGEGQAILVYAYAELGTGKKHAKWQVTNGVGYKYLPSVKIDASKCDNGGTCIPICPKHCFAMDGNKVKVVDEKACILCMSCTDPDICKTRAIKVEGDPTQFLFEFETDGSLSAKDTLLKALEILEAEVRRIQGAGLVAGELKPLSNPFFLFFIGQRKRCVQKKSSRLHAFFFGSGSCSGGSSLGSSLTVVSSSGSSSGAGQRFLRRGLCAAGGEEVERAGLRGLLLIGRSARPGCSGRCRPSMSLCSRRSIGCSPR